MYGDRLSGDRLQKFIEDTLFGTIDNIFRESMDYLDYDQITNLINNAVDHSLVMMYEDYYEEETNTNTSRANDVEYVESRVIDCANAMLYEVYCNYNGEVKDDSDILRLVIIHIPDAWESIAEDEGLELPNNYIDIVTNYVNDHIDEYRWTYSYE